MTAGIAILEISDKSAAQRHLMQKSYKTHFAESCSQLHLLGTAEKAIRDRQGSLQRAFVCV